MQSNNMFPRCVMKYPPDGLSGNTKSTTEFCAIVFSGHRSNISNIGIRQDSISVFDPLLWGRLAETDSVCMSHVFGTSHPFQVIKVVVHGISIFVVDFMRAVRLYEKRCRNETMNPLGGDNTITTQDELIISVSHNKFADFTKFSSSCGFDASNSTMSRYFIKLFKTFNRFPYFGRLFIHCSHGLIINSMLHKGFGVDQ